MKDSINSKKWYIIKKRLNNPLNLLIPTLSLNIVFTLIIGVDRHDIPVIIFHLKNKNDFFNSKFNKIRKMSFSVPVSQRCGLTVLCPQCNMIITTPDERTLKLRIKLHFRKCEKEGPFDINKYIDDTNEIVKKQQEHAVGHKIDLTSKKMNSKAKANDKFLSFK